MSIEQIRSSLNSDDLKVFDNTLSKISMADNVSHTIIGFDDAYNFIVKSDFITKPHTGLVMFRNGKIANTYCY